MKHTTIAAAIADAMSDYLENDEFGKHNPAICRDTSGYYYGSALHGDTVVFDLEHGFGSCEPETADDISDCAACLAEMIQADAE